MEDPKDPEKRKALIEQEIATLQQETLQIIASYAKRLHQSRRRDAKMRGLFLIMSLLFGLLAGYGFIYPAGIVHPWMACAGASLTFSLMATIFTIVDRLTNYREYPTHEKSNTHARTQV